MNWDALQAVGELVAAVAVLISLLYLAAQIKQNSGQLQATTILRFTEVGNETRLRVVESPETADVYNHAVSGAPLDEPNMASRVRLFWVSSLRSAEGSFLLHRAGHLPDDVWAGYWHEQTIILNTPGGRAAFRALAESGLFNPEFVAHLQRDMADPRGQPRDELRTSWDRFLSEERSIGPGES